MPPSRKTVLPGVSTRWISASVRGSSDARPREQQRRDSWRPRAACPRARPGSRRRERAPPRSRCRRRGRTTARSHSRCRCGRHPEIRVIVFADGVDDDRRRDCSCSGSRSSRSWRTSCRSPGSPPSYGCRTAPSRSRSGRSVPCPGVVPGWIFMPVSVSVLMHRRRAVLDRDLQPRARPRRTGLDRDSVDRVTADAARHRARSGRRPHDGRLHAVEFERRVEADVARGARRAERVSDRLVEHDRRRS